MRQIAPHNHRIKCGKYIYQSPPWPVWRHDLSVFAEPITAVSYAQGFSGVV
jgi:hypothetical protein